jgi:hypothetical protein
MENKLNRKDDESLYQPMIHSQRVRTLYSLKLATGKPMTVLLDQAIRELAERHGAVYSLKAEPAFENVEEETWEEIQEYRRLLDHLDFQRCLAELVKNQKQ